MKQNILYILLLATALACGRKDDAYIDLVKKERLLYLGKVDSVSVFPGHNRVKLTWKLTADPQVTRLRVYWNNFKDSLEMPVVADKRTAPMQTILTNLVEGTQSVFFKTMDGEGNSSVPVEVLIDVYGDLFVSGLRPRTLKNAELFDTDLKMDFQKADSTITTTEITYTDKDGVAQRRVVFNNEAVILLPNFPAGGSFSYRSWHQPDPIAIDSLAASWVVTGPKENISALYLKNNKYPFQYAAWDGVRFGSLKDWTENKAAKQRGPGLIYGAYDNFNNSQSFGLSKTLTTDGNIPNGKVYQTVTLPAGKYELVWTNEGSPSPDNQGTQQRFIAVAVGDTLPNVDKINATNALGYASFINVTTARAPFTLTEPKKVALGVVVNWTAVTNSFRAYEIRLLKVAE